jgi:hypothetical protein
MRRGDGLRRTPIARSKLPAGTPAPKKPAKAKRAPRDHVCVGEARCRVIVRERADDRCEIGAAGCWGQLTNMSHRKATGRGGCWCPVNVLGSCGNGNAGGGCHQVVHENRDGEADANGWSVKTAHDPAEVPVVLARWGRSLLRNDGSIVPDSLAA